MTAAPTPEQFNLATELVRVSEENTRLAAEVAKLTEERDGLAAVIEAAVAWEKLVDETGMQGLREVLSCSPTATLAARDAEKKAEGVEIAADRIVDAGFECTEQADLAVVVALTKHLRTLAKTLRTPQQGESQ
jgi:hypothetical protein